MTFWDIYCPVFAALVSGLVVTELVHFGMGYYLHRQQEQYRRDIDAKIASGEIDPRSLMFNGDFGSSGIDLPPMTTISGTRAGEKLGYGQYL